METLKVACIRWGTKYNDLYVTRLKSMVARHLSVPHEFVCYTDRPVEGVTCLPLPSDLPTWWSKVGLFREPAGPTLYLDLDVVICAPIVLPELSDKLWALDDFSYSLTRPKAVDGTINSSVMYWQGDFTEVWTKFTPAVMDRLHGDQNWITRCLWPDRISLVPEGFACSHKYHIERGLKRAPITVYHGNPKPSDVGGAWIRQNWQ